MTSPNPPRILTDLRQRARGTDRRLALPEAGDPRVLEAAARAAEENLCRPLLIGEPGAVRSTAEAHGISLPESVEIVDPAAEPELGAWVEELRASMKERKIPVDRLDEKILDPLWFANLLVRRERADGAAMGAVATTTDTLRAALRIVGPDSDRGLVTSCFLMALADGRVLVYADCGVIPKPTAAQLAEIAVLAAEAHRLWVGTEPTVGLLAFSTHGSARHPSLDPVVEAVDILRRRAVDFAFDGELQADAALVASIGEAKAPGSKVAGRANVLIFPDLNSGNIAYKLTERLAGARAIGPLLLGLAGPVHDLSRGCSVNDILDTLAITALQARSLRATGQEARR